MVDHARTGLVGIFLPQLPGIFVGRLRDERLRVEARIPDFERAHARTLAQVLAIGRYTLHRSLPSYPVGQLVVACGDGKADRQSLQIPFPGRWQGLIEVVEIKNQVALGRREQAEIQQVCVAAGLNLQAGRRGGCKVGGHQRRGAAQEGERAAQHAAVSDRYQFRHTIPIRLFKNVDGIAPSRRRSPVGMHSAGDDVAQGFSCGQALFARAEDLRRPSLGVAFVSGRFWRSSRIHVVLPTQSLDVGFPP